MADDLKGFSSGAFDTNRDHGSDNDRGNVFGGILSVIGNRYFVLALIYVVFGFMVFFTTKLYQI